MDGQREGKHIVPSRVNSGRSLKIEAIWLAQGAAQLVKYLTLLQDFDVDINVIIVKFI